MRPFNLIPPDARRGDRSVLRVGNLSYLIVAALGLILLFAIAVGFTKKQISDRESEVANLQQQEAAASQKAQSLESFTNFRTIQETRTATVASLAQSRFDWDRVLNELARVIPSDVWLVQMSGTVNPTVQLDKGPEISIRGSVPGPALEIVGCATSQDATAGFISDLEDIDGVTRVGVASSAESEDTGTGASGASAASDSAGTSATGGDCRTRSFISRFEIVVAFDAVPAPETATSVPGVPASPAGTAPTTAASTATPAASTTAAPTGG